MEALQSTLHASLGPVRGGLQNQHLDPAMPSSGEAARLAAKPCASAFAGACGIPAAPQSLPTRAGLPAHQRQSVARLPGNRRPQASLEDNANQHANHPEAIGEASFGGM